MSGSNIREALVEVARWGIEGRLSRSSRTRTTRRTRPGQEFGCSRADIDQASSKALLVLFRFFNGTARSSSMSQCVRGGNVAQAVAIRVPSMPLRHNQVPGISVIVERDFRTRRCRCGTARSGAAPRSWLRSVSPVSKATAPSGLIAMGALARSCEPWALLLELRTGSGRLANAAAVCVVPRHATRAARPSMIGSGHPGGLMCRHDSSLTRVTAVRVVWPYVTDVGMGPCRRYCQRGLAGSTSSAMLTRE